jgi:TPP-dependent pyruvate/acetoin dehydrogenase alpha subunit
MAARRSTGSAPAFGAETLTGMLATMVLIRRFEEAVQTLFLRGEVYGSTHLCIGQEAVSAGVAAALEPEDWIACTYRGHGHVLARGSDPQAYMDELLGRATGTSGGRAGSMNIVDLTCNIVGCFGIVGGSLAAATGVALAQKHRGEGVAVGFFGDGAANQAYFHECLNFAQALKLPVVYVCENNGYGEYTPTEQTTPGGIAARPRALGMRTIEVDGQEAWSVLDAAREARAHALEHCEPVFVEARTYRYSDHGRGDPVSYRPEGEMEAWKQRDPIDLAKRFLVDELGCSAEDVEEVDRRETARVEEISARALEAPFPDPDGPALGEFATPVR